MADATTPEPGRGPDDGSVRPYRVIDTRTRRRAGVVYLAMAAVGGLLVLAADVPMMWLTAVIPIALFGVAGFVGAWRMPVTDMRAIEIAAEHASFEVGHGSATLGYRGLAAKPVWQVLVFSDSPSPDRQALVTIDATSGEVTGRYEETIEAP